MGCSQAGSISILERESSLVTLVVSNRTHLIIEKLELMGENFNCNGPLNFRGDTLLHYACARNNLQLVQYLIKQPNLIRSVRNKNGVLPHELTTDK